MSNAPDLCHNNHMKRRSIRWFAFMFSLLAVALLFATVWAVLEYHQNVIEWWHHSPLLNSVILVSGLVLDVLLIVGFLAVGSARFGEADEKCFGTFKGRRNSGEPGGAFRAWLHHMEKKHR